MSETISIPLSKRVGGIGPSATLAASERANQLRAQGVDVLDLGPGQPDFDTPEHIRDAGVRAIREGRTRYTPAAGIPDLREAIADMYSHREGVVYRPNEVMVTAGGKQGLFNIFAAVLNPGDEVIVPTPYWVSFPEQIKLAGGIPVYVDTEESDAFSLRAETILDAVTDRTRMVVLNTPSNPSGAVIGREQMQDLARLAIERGIYLLVDECYAALIYDGAEHVTPLVVGPEAQNITILCGSCSKAYAMTGWRIGYVAAPAPLIKACSSLQGHSTSNATSISQYAALEAITGDQTPVRQMLTTFAERRDAVIPRIREIPGMTTVEPRGAFYAFPNISELLNDELPTSADFATWLIDECHVVTVPGTAFGRDGHLRLSYATSMSVLEEALDRIAAACEKLA
ncbi:MAG: aminotransferase class I/II-fold pyridoxal phosphate-dependent enzyme [Acidobacteria bacterium]|nr:aminotransferase class I/II-fold pyridoxal phosphate-dependent enzyme [Acidobacteriota bacterium]